MAHTEQHYRDAANGLKGALGEQFSRTSLTDSAVSDIHKLASFKDNAELMGINSGSTAGVQQRGVGLARTIQDSKQAQAEKARRSSDTFMFLSLMEQRSTELGREIAELEAEFEAQYGDAWRETIAMQVLDPDEIPQRREGESMIDHRERLEEVLIERMIDPETGQIRPKYKDGGNMERYATWALSQYQKGAIDEYAAKVNDPNTTEAEVEVITQEFRRNHSFAEQYTAEREVTASPVAEMALNEGIDADRDQTTNLDSEMSAFGMGAS